MTYATDAQRATLADDSKSNRNERIAAAWAHGHDRALEDHGEDRVNGFFTVPRGNAIMAELQAMPDGTPVAVMVDAIERHLNPDAIKPQEDHGDHA